MKQFAMAACFAIGVTCLVSPAATLQNKPKPPKSARVYVFDCGLLTLNSPANFGFTKEEVGEKVVLAVPCYLIVHPKGTLMWDTGVIPDAQVDGAPHGISVATRTLRSQMAEIGYAPEDIKYLALSHLHADHTANANDFAGSTWLVHKTERDAMFGNRAPCQADDLRDGLVDIEAVTARRRFLDLRPNAVDDVTGSIGIADNAPERLPDFSQHRRLPVQEVQGRAGVVACRGNRLLDLVSEGRRQHTHHAQAVEVCEL